MIDRNYTLMVDTVNRNASLQAQAFVSALAQQIERNLDAVGALHIFGALLHADGRGDASPSADLVRRYLIEAAEERRFSTLQLALINQQGWLVWSTVPGFRQVDLSDREHFRVHLEGRREPFISAPLVGRASGQWSLQFTRPLLNRDGEFDGVVVASIDPFGLSNQIQTLQPSHVSVATIIRFDGIVLARSQDLESFIGKAVSPEFLRDLVDALSGPQPAPYLYSRSVSEERQVLAVRRVDAWPMIIAVTVDTSSSVVEATSRKQELQVGLILAITTLFALGMFAESRYAQHAARASAERAEARRKEVSELLEALPGVTYKGVLGEKGEWLTFEVSAAFERMVPDGVPSHAVVKLVMLSGLSSEQRLARREALLLRSDFVSEYPITLPNGSTMFLRDQARLLHEGERSSTLSIVGILNDITEEREVKARAIAAAKLATLGEMATGVAHELSQPCAAIGLAADVALLELGRSGAGAPNPKLGTLLESIASQTTRLRDIVDHFRIFARSEDSSGQRFSPNAAIEGALAIMRGSLQTSGIQVDLHIAPDLPEVSGSLVPMEQVLVNVLLNARDAMVREPSATRLIVLAASHQPERKRVVITVRDTGPGIPDGLRHRVFEPFFTTKAAGEGTGLGLSIAYGTLRASNGSIEIENHPDGGALVTLGLSLENS